MFSIYLPHRYFEFSLLSLSTVYLDKCTHSYLCQTSLNISPPATRLKVCRNHERESSVCLECGCMKYFSTASVLDIEDCGQKH